ncbi:tetratricopeptide repeat protein [Nocardiopsis aegyptia]|uniref:tetratricopeptide repeat protein n=1 Tax=Nocardiopsis aegyptia TaxID=220378 RepID=UPI0036728B3D
MPKKNKGKRKTSPSTRPRARVGQTHARAGRDTIGVSHHHGDINYFPGDATPQGAALPAAALPGVEAGFTGRDSDRERLLRALEPSQPGGTVGVSVVGMGGIGKTQLALTAAHHTLDQGWFCQGLFLDLRGYTTPVDAHRALQSLLLSLGVQPDRIPEDPDARRGLYQATLHRKAQEEGPVLIVADNASHPDQVGPLEPGPGGHRLLTTSRERLGGLPARRIDIGVLEDVEAFRVLVADLRLTDPDDERAHDLEGLTQVATACAGLPLALRIAAGQLKNAPDLQPEELAQALAQGADRITRFVDHRALAAVFDTSYRRLPQEQKDLLSLLGMAPGPDISTEAAAVLAGTDQATTATRLRGLAASHLLTAANGRWGMHDLVASYATTLTGSKPPARFSRARRRLLDHYTDQVTAAAQHLVALPGDRVPEAFTDQTEALGWLDAERAVLINTAHLAHRTGHTRAAIDLPLNLAEYLDRRRLFQDKITITRVALHTAQSTGNRRSEALAWNNLGNALAEVRRFEEAIDAHTRARDTCQQLVDAHGEAWAWNNLGLALAEVRRFEEAIDAHTRARDTFQQLGDAHGEAWAWNSLGNALTGVRRFEEAIDAHTRARDTCQQLGDARGEAGAWINLGLALAEVGRVEEAIDAHQRGLTYCQRVGDAHGEALARNNLGVALGKTDRFEEATSWLKQAIDHFGQAGDRHAQGHSCYELGVVLHRSGRPGEAATVLEEAVELLAATHDPHLHAKASEALQQARTET